MGSRMIACVVLLLATFWIRLGISSLDRDSGLVTQTGRQFEDEMMVFEDEIEDFSGSLIAPSPVPAKLKKDYRFLLNSDFELTNVAGNATVLASATDNPQLIPNWFVGENGVQILQNSSYQMSNYAPLSVFAIHLNNPNSTGNSTQGSIATQNLTWAPHPATLYTIQYDCARNPDGPLNLQSALRISSMSGLTVNYFTVHRTKYNPNDTRNQITWIRQSVLIMGTGAATNILFESMSEKYGPIIDNVQILIGVHLLHPFASARPSASMLPLWLLLCPIFTLLVLMTTEH